MSVNLEVKGTLAKLLATEDLIVEHKNVSTASFNVKSRVLTLPRWEKASSNVVDLLVSHEVGHALFTPNEDWRNKTTAPMGFINVVEDARIETLMKQKYPGLPKTFYRGYQELHDQDFFSLEDTDVDEMNIADRVNLYFKVGSFLSITFTDAEKVVVEQVRSARTFDEALAAAEALYALHQEQKEEKEKAKEEMSSDEDEQDSSAGGEGESDKQDEGQSDIDLPQMETDDSGEGEGGQGEGEEEGEEEGETSEDMNSGGGTHGEMSDDVQTMDSLNEALEELTSKSTYGEPVYVTYPKVDLKSKVIPNKEIHEYINKSFATQIEYFTEHAGDRAEGVLFRAFGHHREQFAKFKRDIQSEVNYMVKEFECKKSAAAYARASTSRTGVLDCTRLHTYKYNDDIFKKITTLPEGKNHGLVFILDWSGSMCDVLLDTMKQLISIVMFCDKVGIPFDVYAFTNEWNRRSEDTVEDLNDSDVFHIGYEFGLLNIFSSTAKRKELLRQMENMFVIASAYSSHGYDVVPSKMGLSGTPLNESLIVLRQLLPEFKSRNNVEKAHVMILTDGEAAHCRINKTTTDYKGQETIFASRHTYGDLYLRNRKTGTVTKMEYTPSEFTTCLLNDLRNEFPGSTFTGFRIMEPRAGYAIRNLTNYNEKLQAQWRKEKTLTLTNRGYNKYYVVASTKMQADTEFNVDDGATKAKIKTAFAKSLKGKKSNKRILGDFISLIA